MTDTDKYLSNNQLYQEDDEQDEISERDIEMGQNVKVTDYNNIDDIDFDEQNQFDEDCLNQEQRDKLQEELLFAVQGTGQIKTINGYDVYVKHEHCDESLKDIIKLLSSDGNSDPLVRYSLGDWRFLQNDLLPLLIFHKQDKKLAFFTTMIIYQLTELPNDECKDKRRYYNILRSYKEAFINPKAISILMEHLAYCLQAESRNSKHDKMIELIILIFKHLLQIPDNDKFTPNNIKPESLQKKLLLVFHEESVLDSFIYLTQEFNTELAKKLSMEYLSIQYHIFKGFTPQQIYKFEEIEKQKREEIYAKENARERYQSFLRGTRHSKFGTQLQIMRSDGSSVLISNIYQKNIEINELRGHQRKKQHARHLKNQKVVVEAPNKNQIISEVALEDDDKKLLKILRIYLMDFLEHSYSPLIEQVFSEHQKQSEIAYGFDKFQYFKLSTFMIQICRLQAYDQLQEEKKKAYEEAKKKQAQENLFNSSKSKKVDLPKIPFKINIGTIGASLQLQNFDFLYANLYAEVMKNKQRDQKPKDFHAALQLLTQFLYIIRDMASCNDEKNKKNAQILQQNVFYHDLFKICKQAFLFYQEGVHHKQFLHDTIEFTHLMLQMLEEYSKGKVLTIQTQKKKKVKKPKRQKKATVFQAVQQVELDGDYDPTKPDQLEENLNQFIDQEEYDDSEQGYSGEEEDETEEQFVEKQFNFVSEISVLVDYSIISKYCLILKDKDYQRNPLLLEAVSSFFRRIANQVKATWIFFQLEYLTIFQNILNQGNNNGLMRGLEIKTSLTSNEKRIGLIMVEFKQVVTYIVRQFLDQLQKNRFLGIECLFKFQSREIVDDILNNYSNLGQKNQQHEDNDEHQFDQDAELSLIKQRNKEIDDKLNKQEEKTKKNEEIVWKEEEDNILIDNYEQFKDLGKQSCFELLGQLISNKSAKQCYKRAKLLKLTTAGVQKARELSKLMKAQDTETFKSVKVTYSLKKFLKSHMKNRTSLPQFEIQSQMDYIEKIYRDFSLFKQLQDDQLICGQQADLDDLRRGNIMYTLVPTTNEEFEILNDLKFQQLLSCFEIQQPKYGQMQGFYYSTHFQFYQIQSVTQQRRL